MHISFLITTFINVFFERGNANRVSLSIYLCRTIELYKASENTSGIQHFTTGVSVAPVVSLKSLDCRHNRLAQTLQPTEGSYACAFIIQTFNESRLITVIDGYTCAILLPTIRHQCTVAK